MCLFKRLKIKNLTKKIIAMQQYRLYNQVKDEDHLKEISYYHELVKIYQKCINHKAFPFAAVMVIECLRAAASLDCAESQYRLGAQFLEEAKFRQALEKEGLFTSSSNQRAMQTLYTESMFYLQAAEKLGNIQAKRLRGLCYINGFGVPVDKENGFELIVASIEQENSWDRVPAIFAEIGLNKPEFFTALMTHRKKT